MRESLISGWWENSNFNEPELLCNPANKIHRNFSLKVSKLIRFLWKYERICQFHSPKWSLQCIFYIRCVLGIHTVASVSRQVGEAYSFPACCLTSGFEGYMNVYMGTLLFVSLMVHQFCCILHFCHKKLVAQFPLLKCYYTLILMCCSCDTIHYTFIYMQYPAFKHILCCVFMFAV